MCGLCGAQELCQINPLPADRDAATALNDILEARRLPNVYFLYRSSNQLMKQYGGAASIDCLYAGGLQQWIVYDPELIKGDQSLHFALAHELAHHLHNDSMSGEDRSEKQELDADKYAAEYLASPPLIWTREKLIATLNDLSPARPVGTHPSLEARVKSVIEGFEEAHVLAIRDRANSADSPAVYFAARPGA